MNFQNCLATLYCFSLVNPSPLNIRRWSLFLHDKEEKSHNQRPPHFLSNRCANPSTPILILLFRPSFSFFLFFFFLKILFIYSWETERGRGRGRSRLPAEQGARCGTWSEQNTDANPLNYPGTQPIIDLKKNTEHPLLKAFHWNA